MRCVKDLPDIGNERGNRDPVHWVVRSSLHGTQDSGPRQRMNVPTHELPGSLHLRRTCNYTRVSQHRSVRRAGTLVLVDFRP